ncbi:MAG: hydroxymethylglutaryl-CoA reductase, degradative [Sandaracinaceae bacterium]|nr:hydroxymethylglutaryl-CoA reductase, degradative [Myxococcales bacterium]
MTSSISGLYRLTVEERRERIQKATGLDAAALSRLEPLEGLSGAQADRMVENALGVFGLPFGVCVNMQIDGRDVLAPMVVEEPSVVAACSYAAKLLRAGGGVEAHCSEPRVIGQIQLMEVEDPKAATEAILAAEEELLALASSGHPRLAKAGGGARALRVRELPRLEADDPCGDMLVVHLSVDVRDAMGANAVNSMCERIAPRIAELSGGRVALRILSNLTDERTVTVIGRVPFAMLDGKGTANGEELAKRIEEASVFAERDPYRACTHNKGIMNGVDAALIALGQDWRAVEAGAHAYAAKDGRYTAMARWRVEDGHLVGRMTIPLAVGTVGGVAKSHPVVAVARDIAQVRCADDVAKLCASVGLAQNLGALRALAAEGIQRGHMRLHARNIAIEAGAEEHEVLEVAKRIADAGKVNARHAADVIRELRGTPEATPTPIAIAARKLRKRPPTPATPPIEATVEDEMSELRPIEHELGGTILVTGASGHLGANLVHRLLEEDGVRVRVLLREGSNNAAMDGLPVERVYGDLRDRDALDPAVEGCRYVFHVAAQLSTVEPTPEIERAIWESNVLGTRNLLAAARLANVERVVVTGSFSATGYDLDDPSAVADETMPFWPFGGSLPYVHSKQLVEHETLKACVEGLDAVIVTSCALLGPHDYKPSRMGQTLVDFANGKMPAYIPGGFSFVAARDIVEGHIRGLQRGATGQKYIIATQYVEVDELMGIFEEVSGHPRPKIRLPASVMAPVAEVSSFVLGNFFPGKSQRLTPAAVKILDQRRRASFERARRELGYEPTGIRQAVHEAYADFARRGFVPAREGTTEAPVTERTEETRARAATGS